MEIPPRMPSRGFRVCRASSSPSGAKISTSSLKGRAGNSCGHQWANRRMIFRGTGLMAGSPGQHRQAGLGHPAHAFPAPEDNFAFRSGAVEDLEPGPDLGSMGDIRVIAGVLNNSAFGPGTCQTILVHRYR